MRTLVWLDATDQSEWNIAVEEGEAVRWPTVSFASGWLRVLVGGELPVPVRWEDPDEAPDGEVVGTVKSIRILVADHQRRAPRRTTPYGEPPGGVWERVPGSGRLAAVDRISEQEFVNPFRPEHQVQGWIVEIEHVWMRGAAD